VRTRDNLLLGLRCEFLGSNIPRQRHGIYWERQPGTTSRLATTLKTATCAYKAHARIYAYNRDLKTVGERYWDAPWCRITTCARSSRLSISFFSASSPVSHATRGAFCRCWADSTAPPRDLRLRCWYDIYSVYDCCVYALYYCFPTTRFFYLYLVFAGTAYTPVGCFFSTCRIADICLLLFWRLTVSSIALLLLPRFCMASQHTSQV